MYVSLRNPLRNKATVLPPKAVGHWGSFVVHFIFGNPFTLPFLLFPFCLTKGNHHSLPPVQCKARGKMKLLPKVAYNISYTW